MNGYIKHRKLIRDRQRLLVVINNISLNVLTARQILNRTLSDLCIVDTAIQEMKKQLRD